MLHDPGGRLWLRGFSRLLHPPSPLGNRGRIPANSLQANGMRPLPIGPWVRKNGRKLRTIGCPAWPELRKTDARAQLEGCPLTYKLVGPMCKEPDCSAPAYKDGWCRSHYDLASFFGYRGDELSSQLEPPADPPLTEADVLAWDSTAFLADLNRWRDEAA